MAKYRKMAKSASPDYWAFLQEIDAPQWVDLASEEVFNVDERDDGWFQTLHPFHTQSFHELVSPSPLGVQKKGMVSNSVRLYPGLLNSVSKSRGGKPFPWTKVSAFRPNSLEVNNTENRQTRRLSGRKPANFKSNANAKIGRNACLQKPSNEATTKSCLQLPSKGNGLDNPLDATTSFKSNGNSKTGPTACLPNFSNKATTNSCSQILSKGNALDNPVDGPAFLKFKGNVKIGPNACLHKPSSEASTKACSQIASEGNELVNSIDEQVHSSAVQDCKNRSASACLQISTVGNKLENPLHVQARSLTVCDPCEGNQLANLSDLQARSSASSGLISMLKAASLRRSCGVPPMRVEVKDDTNRKTSSLGSTGNNSQQVEKEDTLKQMKNQSQISTMTFNKHNMKKSIIGSTTTLKEEAKNGCRSSIQHSRKKASTGSSNITEESNDIAMKYNKFGQALKEPGRKQGQTIGKDSGKLERNHGQPIRGRKVGAELSTRGKTATRRPLKDLNNVGLSQHKSDILQNQRFSGKENNQLGTTLHQKINRTERKKPLTNIRETIPDQEESKVHAALKDESTLHSIKDIKQWEKNSSRSYFSLNRMEKEKANRQIQICKSLS